MLSEIISSDFRRPAENWHLCFLYHTAATHTNAIHTINNSLPLAKNTSTNIRFSKCNKGIVVNLDTGKVGRCVMDGDKELDKNHQMVLY